MAPSSNDGTGVQPTRDELSASGRNKIYTLRTPLELSQAEINALGHEALLEAFEQIVTPIHGRRATEQEQTVVGWLEGALYWMDSANLDQQLQDEEFAARDVAQAARVARSRQLSAAYQRVLAGEDLDSDEEEQIARRSLGGGGGRGRSRGRRGRRGRGRRGRRGGH